MVFTIKMMELFLVKEKWTWRAQKKEPIPVGFNIHEQRFAIQTDAEKMPWGVNSVAKAKKTQTTPS